MKQMFFALLIVHVNAFGWSNALGDVSNTVVDGKLTDCKKMKWRRSEDVSYRYVVRCTADGIAWIQYEVSPLLQEIVGPYLDVTDPDPKQSETATWEEMLENRIKSPDYNPKKKAIKITSSERHQNNLKQRDLAVVKKIEIDKEKAEIESERERTQGKYGRGCHQMWPNDRKTLIGKGADEIRRLCGPPLGVNRTVSAASEHEQWDYDSAFFYFRDGVLFSFQD